MLYKLFQGVYAVADLPLVYIPSFRAVIMADIHLGFEEDMASKGIFLPRIQLDKVLEIVDGVVRYINASILIIAGDIKHHFEKLGKREAKDLKEFLSVVTKRFEKVIVVRGNHDTYLLPVCKRFGVLLYDILWLDHVLVMHGHRELEYRGGFDLLIIGHEHPSIAIKDPATGYNIKFQCFLLAPLARGGHVLILPASGLYQSGTTISLNTENYLSPILRKDAILEEAKPFIIAKDEGVIELPNLKMLKDLMFYT